MEQVYQIVERRDSQELAAWLSENGQALLPMVELIEQGQMVVEEFIGVLGRAALEAVLDLSAAQVAGPPHQGRTGGEVRRHGKQPGSVRLSTQKVRVDRPRLRHKSGGEGAEVAVPAYEAMQSDPSLGERLCAILMSGVSKSAVSREFAAASAEQLRALCERRLDALELLVIYLDGVRFGPHHVVAAIGVAADGRKHLLGLAEGATENATVVRGLLEDLVQRGVSPERRRLFVIDGSKALRSAIDTVFGAGNPLQRCRKHKIDNVTGHLPRDLAEQVRSVMKAAYKLDADEGMSKLKQQARWLETEYPCAAASLLEGLEETFTINRLGLPATLRRCLGTTNIVESPTLGVRLRTRRVTNWRHGQMVLRWAAAAYLDTEKNFRRIMGYRDLWILKAALDDGSVDHEEVKIA